MLSIEPDLQEQEAPNILELFTDLVFLVGISWYFSSILPTNTEAKGSLGWYISVSIIWREPPFP
jgi:hypothetical protein